MKHIRISANRLLACLSLALASAAPMAAAQDLGAASGYSYFVFGDVSQSNAQSKGAAAVGGNATFSGYGLGEQLPSSSKYSLVVGGDLNYSDSVVHKGSLLVGGTSKLTNVAISGGTASQGSLIDFDAAKTQYGGLSDKLAGMGANSNYSLSYGNLVFTGTDGALNTFTIKAADFQAASSMSINAPMGSTVVINVAGDLINFQNLGLTVKGTDKSMVLYNFYEATSLNLAGLTVLGSVLAPDAHVKFSNGTIQGTLISDSMSGGGTFEYSAFKGALPTAVPEPSGVALIGAAGALALLRRRR
ncbi:MAG: choice-of-anchor A family protein [Verrucomicrobiaceae bacterium]|nr:MAG: choice-of-anchor A family protein [Verrucomicrobiaceae bacterium]